MWVKVSPKVLVKLVSPLLLFIALAVAVASVAARRSQRTTRGLLELAGAIKCSTGRNALAYMMYGCYCGLGGQGWPRDKADWWGRALITLLSNLTEENSSMSTLLLFLKISCLQTKMKTPNWHSIHDPPKHYVVQKISLSMHWMWLVLHGAHTWFQFFSVILQPAYVHSVSVYEWVDWITNAARQDGRRGWCPNSADSHSPMGRVLQNRSKNSTPKS